MSNQNQSELTLSQNKYYSILPDLATGWRPRNLKIAAPILLTFEENLNNSVFNHYLRFLHKLLFIGPRHENSYKFHSLTQHGYTIRYGLKYEEVPIKLQRQLQQFTMKNNERKGPFQGMNPSLPNELKFDSNFESGNLDLVIKINDNQYNLFLRPDTNTQGHMQWFYFKITKNSQYTSKTIKLNICNNRKSLTLFHRGMKPFVYSKAAFLQRNQKWRQTANCVTYSRLGSQDCFMKQYILNQNTNSCFQPEEIDKYKCLSFEYTFEADNDEVYFAYCPPFTYTDMKEHVQLVKKKAYYDKSCSVAEEILCSSMSGLEIPVLTITNPNCENEGKKCVIAMGRIHPGQSNGSFVMKGFLEYLISPQAQELRNKIIFKVIPMINPDGVVFGNYRTSISGKDLNRKFKAKNQELFPEIIYLKEFVANLKKQNRMKLTYFLDFHGHSVKKNIFTYGPQYDIWTTKYEKAKIFPRILATKTPMFRLQSCLYKVATSKKTTARAYMLSMIPYCYTIQSSVGLYRSFEEHHNHDFTPQKWCQAGFHIGEGLKDTIITIFETLPSKSKIKKKQNGKSKKFVDDHGDKLSIQKADAGLNRTKSVVSFSRNYSSKKSKRKNVKKNWEKLKIVTASNFQFPQIEEVQERQEESDEYSQGRSDCQSDDNDLDKAKYQNLSGKIMKMIESFNHLVIGAKKNKIRIKSKVNNNKSKNKLVRKTNMEEIKFMPSLKYRVAKRNLSQKKISIEENSLQSSSTVHKLTFYKLCSQKRNTNSNCQNA